MTTIWTRMPRYIPRPQLSPRRFLADRSSGSDSVAPNGRKRTTLRTLREQYLRGEPITMVTAYDYPSARHVDGAGVDVALVGDSLGMVVLGHATTQRVTLSQMVHHAAAARRGVQRAMLIADLPFGTFEDGATVAARSARELVQKGGVDAVKLEGGVSRAHLVHAVVQAGIACMAHVGLTPQASSALGGFRPVGRTAAEACHVLDDALAVQRAGAFAVLLECVPAKLAQVVTSKLSVPTIGIGAGNACSGQVLVYHDMLGVNATPGYSHMMPGFAKRYTQVGEIVHTALREYVGEVKSRQFPSEEYTKYSMEEEDFAEFCDYADSHPDCAAPLKVRSRRKKLSNEPPDWRNEEDKAGKLF